MISEIIPYKKAHAFELFERGIQEVNFHLSSVGDWEKLANDWEIAGPAFTIVLDGRPIACGGFALYDKSFAECWAFILQTEHGIVVYRNILKKFREMIEQHKFRRLQALVIDNFESGTKLIEHLGFEHVAPLRKYGPNGETMQLFERVF